jgi:hypothetical protein
MIVSYKFSSVSTTLSRYTGPITMGSFAYRLTVHTPHPARVTRVASQVHPTRRSLLLRANHSPMTGRPDVREYPTNDLKL